MALSCLEEQIVAEGRMAAPCDLRGPGGPVMITVSV
jgi:hypothetical protein